MSFVLQMGIAQRRGDKKKKKKKKPTPSIFSKAFWMKENETFSEMLRRLLI